MRMEVEESGSGPSPLVDFGFVAVLKLWILLSERQSRESEVGGRN